MVHNPVVLVKIQVFAEVWIILFSEFILIKNKREDSKSKSALAKDPSFQLDSNTNLFSRRDSGQNYRYSVCSPKGKRWCALTGRCRSQLCYVKRMWRPHRAQRQDFFCAAGALDGQLYLFICQAWNQDTHL